MFSQHYIVSLYLFVSFFCYTHVTASVTGRIIGGSVAYAGQFPFSAAIYKTTSEGRYFCGGTLLNQEWIVTSGLCVQGTLSFSILLGTNNIVETDPDTVRLTTDYYVLHPEFNADTLENDIGLIKLRIPITFNTYVQPIDFLPTTEILPNSQTIAVGWGQTNDSVSGLVDSLRYVTLSVLTNEECRLIFGNQIAETMMCVEGNYNEGACHGDSGGPLVQVVGGQRGFLMLVGVSSFISTNGCESADPSGYTRIFPFSQWIYNVTGMD